MLTEEQLEHFYREGYVVVPGLVPTDEIDKALAAAPQGTVEAGGGWGARPFAHDNPDQDAALHRLLVEPHVVEAVQDIFAAPARVLYGMLAIVPAYGGKGLPWHQDNQYGQILGGALNAFIALCDITPDKAILWVAPQSHRLGTQPSKDSELYGAGHREAAMEPQNGMPLPAMKKGDACIFDRDTYHRTLRNESAEDRYAYAAQYQSDHAREANTGKRDPSKMLATDLQKRWRKLFAA